MPPRRVCAPLFALLTSILVLLGADGVAGAPRPAVELIEESDRLALSDNGRTLRWDRRRVVVYHRPGGNSGEFRGHALVETFGSKPLSARVTRIAATGRRRSWTLDDYFVEPYLSEGGFISDARVHILPLEHLAAGDTVLFESEERVDPFLGFPVLQLGDARTPPIRRHLEVVIPSGLEPEYRLHNGAPEPRITESGALRSFLWEPGPAAPLSLGAWSPDAVDLLPAVSLGVSRTAWGPARSWEELAAGYMAELGRRGVDLPRVTAAARPAGLQDVDMLAAELAAVQRDVRYVSIAIGPGGMIPFPPEEVSRRQFGDCKDMSLLLLSRIQSQGIEAALALVHTLPPAPERLDPLPTLLAFNHAVVYVASDTSGYWLDPTDRFGTPLVPRRDIQGAPALILSGPHVGYRRIPRLPATVNRVASHLTLTPEPDEPWRLSGDVRWTGTPATDLMHRLAGARPATAGDRVAVPAALLPLAPGRVEPETLVVTRTAAASLEVRGSFRPGIQSLDLEGRTEWPLPWSAVPAALAGLPDETQALPMVLSRSRTYADTLVFVDDNTLFESPAEPSWSIEGPRMAARGTTERREDRLILTRHIHFEAGWHSVEEQSAVRTFLSELRRHNVLPLRQVRH